MKKTHNTGKCRSIKIVLLMYGRSIIAALYLIYIIPFKAHILHLKGNSVEGCFNVTLGPKLKTLVS